MADDHEVLEGLLDWVNSLHVAEEEVFTADEVKDGKIIWKVLQQIDRLSFPGDLPEKEPEGWVQRWTNLKHIYDAVSIFLVEECEQRLPLLACRPDLKSIAQNGSEQDCVYLLKLLVIAAINCNNRLQYLENMQSLVIPTQEVLMKTAQEAGEEPEEDVQDEEEEEPSYMSSPSPRSNRNSQNLSGVDSELASEERLGKVIADNQRIAQEKRELQRQLESLYENHTKLQQRYDKSWDELTETKDRLTSVLAGKTEYGINKSLDTKQETVIATLEDRLAASDEELDTLRKSNEVLRIKAEKVQKMQDEYDEIKIERDKLSRKANAAEKYKQKLEASQDLEKENTALRDKITNLQSQIRQSDSRSLSSNDLQREIDEYRRLLPSIEQERHELNEMKKRLEFEYHALEARHQDALEQLRRQGSTVEELQGRLQDYEDGTNPSTPKPNGEQSLKTEDSGPESEDEEITSTSPSPSPAPAPEKDASIPDQDPETDIPDTDTSDDLISETELSAIMTAMRAQATASSSQKFSNLLDKGMRRYRQLASHAQKQAAVIAQLQADAKAQEEREKEREKEVEAQAQKAAADSQLSTAGAEAAPPSSHTHIHPDTDPEAEGMSERERLRASLAMNANLKRELKLMSSAWYAQNSRVMQNSYLSGAGGGGGYGGREPKSILGRGRRVVEEVMLGR